MQIKSKVFGTVTIIKTRIGDVLKFNIQLAELLAPSIVILDDIDLSLGSRNNGSPSKYLGTFLDVLDGTDKINKNVGIISTTNSSGLLDLAAQRPGRFDKIMLFDEIRKEDIKKIILKSLKYNFGLNGNSEITKKITSSEIIDLYHDSKITGSHIFNNVNVLVKKHDAFDGQKNKISIKWIISEIEDELEIFDKIKQHREITDRFEKKSNGLGFHRQDEDEMEAIPCEVEKSGEECGEGMTKKVVVV